jgi:hypothetical protein
VRGQLAADSPRRNDMLIGLIAATLGLREPPVEPTVRSSDTVAVRIVSGATVAREDLVMSDAGDSAIGTLTLTLTAKQTIAASTMIELPRGSRIVGMTLDHDGARLIARSLELVEANRRFTETVDPPPEITVPRPPRERDPAVLQLDHSGDSEWVRLTVFPISPDAPATVTVTFATAQFGRIEVYASGRLRHALVRGDLAKTTDANAALAHQPTRLEPGLVLYAAPAAPAPTEEELARRFQAVLPTLARCAAVDDSVTAQRVSVGVDVDELGRTTLRSSQGAGRNLVDCLQQVVEHVQFADDAATSLTVPLDVTPLVVRAAAE